MMTVFSFILNVVLFIVFSLLILLIGLILSSISFKIKIFRDLNKSKKQVNSEGLPDFNKLSPPLFRKEIDKKLNEIFGSLDYKNYLDIRYIYSGNNRKIEQIVYQANIKEKPSIKCIKKAYRGALFLNAVNRIINKQG